MQYMIVESEYKGKLKERVEFWIDKQWTLQGGLCVYQKPGGLLSPDTVYAQAMVKNLG